MYIHIYTHTHTHTHTRTHTHNMYEYMCVCVSWYSYVSFIFNAYAKFFLLHFSPNHIPFSYLSNWHFSTSCTAPFFGALWKWKAQEIISRVLKKSKGSCTCFRVLFLSFDSQHREKRKEGKKNCPEVVHIGTGTHVYVSKG